MATCEACGGSYGITHTCPGKRPEPAPDPRWAQAAGGAPARYLRQARAIARWDNGAVLAASHDSRATAYGWVIWLVGQILLFASALAFAPRAPRPGPAEFILGAVVLIVLQAIFLLAQIGCCHLLAGWLFAARGTYRGLLRPLLLGAIITWLFVIPFVGRLVGSLGFLAVLMLVFENVDGISKLKAFGLAASVGVLFTIFSLSLLHLR